jgi:hypothetical protein
LDRSPSRTWASKPAFERWQRAGSLALGGFALTLSACVSGYPLSATVCDDYCRATQRADCDDDEPADCVRDCEQARGASACDAPLAKLSRCYQQSDPGAFACVDDHTRFGPLCATERRELDECRLPGSGACFDECVRQAQSCEGELDACERGCKRASDTCQEASDRYNACLLGHPVECRAWLQMETRPPEEIPCYDEALAVLGVCE